MRMAPITREAVLQMETGTLAFFVSDELTGAGLAPQVIDAREVRRTPTRPRQKSDRRDAFELCEGLRREAQPARGGRHRSTRVGDRPGTRQPIGRDPALEVGGTPS
jgi:transposase